MNQPFHFFCKKRIKTFQEICVHWKKGLEPELEKVEYIIHNTYNEWMNKVKKGNMSEKLDNNTNYYGAGAGAGATGNADCELVLGSGYS